MQIILNTDDTLRLVLLGLKAETGLTPTEIYIGPIKGEIAVVASVGEEIPQGTFDDDETDPVAENVSSQEKTNVVVADAPKKRRKRRTKEEIAADEAAAKQAAETKQPQQASGEAEGESQDAKQPEAESKKAEEILEAEPEAGSDQAETAEGVAEEAAGSADDLFGSDADSSVDGGDVDPEGLFEAEPTVTSSASNPFGEAKGESSVDDESLDLFSDPAPSAEATKPVTETEAGFVKPAGTDDVLKLFD